ncbi:MAG TPA: trypsin-like peptidase domain-containing protein [Pseudonocardia sp.]|jgi:hypothetical protein|nr:trypsin-like peptidase domain-containing protein [Pseudonocardia sp.]
MSLRDAIRHGRARRCLVALGLLAVASTAVTATSVATPGTARAAGSTIHPGVMLNSPQGQCTANFIFRASGRTLIGQAAHCTGKGDDTQTDGCKTQSAPLGTRVKIDGASRPGRLVYNSWIAMRNNNESNKAVCAFNDFALVEIDPADEGRVDPTVPEFGGPEALRSATLRNGAAVYSYQNSNLRQGLAVTSPKKGVVLDSEGGGRSYRVSTLVPGVPGDSGSGFMDAQGNAFGVLSTLNLDPTPGSNGVGNLGLEVAYASQHGGLGEVRLVRGERPFKPSGGGLLPAL